MSEPVDPPVDHPDELLAGYVDGSADAADRRAVEEHLESCEACRHDVALAARASAALASLPELGAPGLAAAGVASLRRAAFHPLPDHDSDVEPAPVSAGRTPPRRFRLAWSQLAAAAAIIVVLGALVAIPLALSGDKAGKPTGAALAPAPATSPAPAHAPALIDRGAVYSHESLNALAGQLAATREGSHSPFLGGIKASTPEPNALQDSAIARGALQCVIQGGAPPENAQPIYLEQAEVSGTPAYVGGFFIPEARLNVMVVAVSRDGCGFLYGVSQPG